MKYNRILTCMLVVVLSLGLVGSVSARAAEMTRTFQASQDYSGVQGQGQWFNQRLSGTVYLDLDYHEQSKQWQADTKYPWISATAMHPGQDFDAVRKWVSPGKGKIRISGTVSKGDSEGDGVLATIKRNTVTLWSSEIKSAEPVHPTGVEAIDVDQGTEIYFIVNRVNRINNDHTNWNPTIHYEGNKPGATALPQTLQAKAPLSAELSVQACGAVPNDDKDDYAAFVACIAKARSTGQELYVPEGRYHLSNIITLDGVSMKGAGMASTVLISTNPARGSIDIRGEGVKVSDFKHVYNTTVPRGDGSNEKNSFTVRGATGFELSNLHVVKSSTAGIMVRDGASDGLIAHNIVESTGADGIHVTSASHNIRIESNHVKATGDDGIAVVSYAKDPAVSRDVTIRKNNIGHQSKARGIAIVGAQDVHIENNNIKDTMMAGIYISVEKTYDTRNVERVTVVGNTIDHSGMDAVAKHPNILVYASQGMIDEVKFTGNTITNAAYRGIGVWGTGQIKNIYYSQNKLVHLKSGATTFTSGTIHLSDNIGF
ncbi:right-handed parallel beta-helix repeat-containing protein [Paenibacillus sp. 1P07SE]|uniref:right-handed parallel beta-helix repeat-containing protein n=1 Tax=Paenibacillus sp. 1P07SE TaxID=3132209 RepID=UPI0039A49ECA